MEINKQGELLSGETLELLLSAGAVFVLLTLFFAILAPTFNRPKEAAKQYLNELDKQLRIAEQGGIGEFEISKVPSGGELYVINFNEQYGASFEGNYFYNPTAEKRTINVCYSTKESDSGCTYLLLLYPIRLEETPTPTKILVDQCLGLASCQSTCFEGQKIIGECLISVPARGTTMPGKCCTEEQETEKSGAWAFTKGNKYRITLQNKEYVFKKIT